LGCKHIGVTTQFDPFPGHMTSSVIGHVTIRFSIGHFLFASSNRFPVRRTV